MATFGSATFQHAGLSDNFQSAFAIFSTRDSTTQVFARSNFGGGSTDTPVGALVGTPHRYRIEWDTNQVRYFVDGNLVATHSGTFSTALRVAVSDFNAGGAELSVDWMRMSPYPATGTFDSRVLDAGQSVNWDALSWTADTPAGTGVALSVRTGNTPTPDGSWSGFNPVGSSGGSIGGNSRYLQYRVQLSSSDQGKTPTLSDVSASYAADTTAPDTQIDTGPSGTSSNPSPAFGFSADESGSSFECRLDSSAPGDWAACSSPKPYTNLADGSHTFEVRATDGAGNTDQTPASRTWTIDTGAPDTQIDTGPSGTSTNPSPAFGFSADESGSSFECRLDSSAPGDWAVLLLAEALHQPRRRLAHVRGPGHRRRREHRPDPGLPDLDDRHPCTPGSSDHRHRSQEPRQQQQPADQGDRRARLHREAIHGGRLHRHARGVRARERVRLPGPRRHSGG